MKYFGHEEPLGMPKGSVRAIALYVLLGVVAIVQIASVAQSLGSGTPVVLIEVVGTLMGTAVGFYFGARSNGGGG